MDIPAADRTTARPYDRKTKYTRNSKTISGRLHDEMVMMDLEQGKYFSLNPVATRIWELLDKPRNVDEICGILMEEYEVESDRCWSDVSQVLKDLLGMNLLLSEDW